MAQKEEMPKSPTFPFGPPCVSTDWMDWINYSSHIHFPRGLNLMIWVIHPSSHVSIHHFQPLWGWVMMQASWRVFRMFCFWHLHALSGIPGQMGHFQVFFSIGSAKKTSKRRCPPQTTTAYSRQEEEMVQFWVRLFSSVNYIYTVSQ